MHRKWPVVLFTLVALLAAACGDDDASDDGGSETTEAMSCAVEDLNLITPGTLTVATGEPAFPPWVSGIDGENFDDPTSKTGYEAALVYEIAAQLGFSDDQVVWVRTGFDEAIAPGDKTFDFNLQQYSITAERDEVVDFSDPYYTTRQALIAPADSVVVGATSFADLADARLGASIGSTSLAFIEDVIQPNQEVAVYDTNADAKAAFDAGQLDGLVLDLPTAYFVTAVEIEDAVVVAQFGADAADADEFGLLFAEGNPLVDCVNDALATLNGDGTFAALEAEWLAQGGEVTTIDG